MQSKTGNREAHESSSECERKVRDWRRSASGHQRRHKSRCGGRSRSGARPMVGDGVESSMGTGINGGVGAGAGVGAGMVAQVVEVFFCTEH